MTRLCDLSEDVLRLILDGDTSINAVALWMTFDRQMRSRLANGGITDLILPTLYIPRDVSWPGYLRFWKLRSLRILDFEWDTPQAVGPQLQASLRQLWNGIETIEFRGPEAVTSAFQLEASSTPSSQLSSPSYALHTPAKRSYASESAVPQPDEDTSGPWNMNITHPSLKTLIINGNNFEHPDVVLHRGETKRPFPRLVFGSTAFLPRSLTHLDLSKTHLELSANDCLHLPPQLTVLWLPFCSPWGFERTQNPTLLPAINLHNIDCLPHSLTHVAAKKYPASCYTAEALLELARPGRKCLPNLAVFPLVESVEILYNIHCTYGWPSDMNDIYLKSHLQRQAPKIPSDWISRGTPLWPIDWIGAFNGVIRQLPNTLTRLSAGAIDWQFVESSKSLWPSTLTSMDIDTGNAQPYFSLLPRTLRILSTAGFRPGADFYHDLPQLGRDCLTNIDGDKWSTIKQQLLSYPGIDTDTQRRMEIEAYISEVEDGALYGLPLTLEEVYQNDGYKTHAVKISLLPPLVRRVELYGGEIWKPKQSPLRALPPYLTALLHQAQLAPAADWQQLPTHSSTGPRSLLNSNITSLTLFSGVDLRLAQHLPRGLIHLSIIALSTFNAAGLAPLTALKSLKVQGLSAMVPKVGWASTLPRNLTHIDIDAPLEGADYKNLPPTLEILCVNPPSSRSRFKAADIDARPSTLHKGKLTRNREPVDEDHLESWPQIRKQLIDLRTSQSRRK